MRGKELPPLEVKISEEQYKCLKLAVEELKRYQFAQDQTLESMDMVRRKDSLPVTGSIQIMEESKEYINRACKFFDRSIRALTELGKIKIEPNCRASEYNRKWYLENIRCTFSGYRGDDMDADDKTLLPDPRSVSTAFLKTLFGSDYPNGGWVESRLDYRRCLEILRSGRAMVMTYQLEEKPNPHDPVEYYI